MTKLVEEIDKYIREFSSQSLCDGSKVTDALLDIRMLANDCGSTNIVESSVASERIDLS